MHSDLTLFWRVVPSGKRVVYYYARDENDIKRGPWSTGQESKTLARNYCNKLLREGKLIPNNLNEPTFAEYAKDFWDWEKCAYLKKRRLRYSITQGYALKNRHYSQNVLVPYFGKMKMSKITSDDVEHWIDEMKEKEYKNNSINSIYGTLKTMMVFARKQKIIREDPTEFIERLINDRSEIKIITPLEFKKLFVDNWKNVWDKDRIGCLGNKLMALTGMRSSEVIGLRGEFVFDDHIYLEGQFDEYGYRPIKTKTKHNIPLTPELVQELKELIAMNGNGYVFSVDGGATPVSRRWMYNNLHYALNCIGIKDEEIAERHLHLHAWRHFANTELQKAGVSIQKVQEVIRHRSDRMTKAYSHFDANEFNEVRQAQEALLHPGKDCETQKNRSVASTVANKVKKATKKKPLKLVKPGNEKSKGKIIKMPDSKASKAWKQA